MWAIQILSLLCLLAVGVHSIVLDATCATDADCVATNPNSYCKQLYSSGDVCITGKVCKCKDGYTGTDCAGGVVPKYLGETCTLAAECATVTSAVCSGTPLKCTCPAGETQISKYNCVASTFKKIGEACVTGDTCYYEHDGVINPTGSVAACTAAFCVCPVTKTTSGTTCLPAKIGDVCTGSTSCPTKSTCAGTPTTVCTCESTFAATIDNTACVLSANPKSANEVCVITDHPCDRNANLECVECLTSAVATTKCAKKTGLIGDTCVIDSDCISKLSSCNAEKKCACAAGYSDTGKLWCGTTGGYTSACWTSDDCTVPGNVCTDNVCILTCTDANKEPNDDGTACVCKADRELDAAGTACVCRVAKPVDVDGTCVTGQLGSACTDSGHCKFENSLCKDRMCACAVGFKKDNYKCVTDSGATLGATCATDADCVATNQNTYCKQLYSSGDACITGKVCKCRRGYTGATCTGVVPKYLGETCTAPAECAAVDRAVCTASKCACPTGETQISKYNCVASTYKKIGEACAAGDTCYYEHDGVIGTGSCPTGNCVCPAMRTTSGTTCMPAKIGDVCTGSTSCPTKSTCTGTQTVCTCETGFTATTDKTACVLSTNPKAANAECLVASHPCDRNANLECVECTTHAVATTKCAKKTGLIGDTCVIDSDCISKLSSCNTEKKCACAAGYADIGKLWCGTTGGYNSACWDAIDCTATGNVCTNHVCVCDADREPKAGGCVCKPAKPVDVGGICVAGVAGLKAAWIPLITLSGLISILSLTFF